MTKSLDDLLISNYQTFKTVEKSCSRSRKDVRPIALPRYHGHTRWTLPLLLASNAPCRRSPRRASAQLMT